MEKIFYIRTDEGGYESINSATRFKLLEGKDNDMMFSGNVYYLRGEGPVARIPTKERFDGTELIEVKEVEDESRQNRISDPYRFPSRIFRDVDGSLVPYPNDPSVRILIHGEESDLDRSLESDTRETTYVLVDKNSDKITDVVMSQIDSSGYTLKKKRGLFEVNYVVYSVVKRTNITREASLAFKELYKLNFQFLTGKNAAMILVEPERLVEASLLGTRIRDSGPIEEYELKTEVMTPGLEGVLTLHYKRIRTKE